MFRRLLGITAASLVLAVSAQAQQPAPAMTPVQLAYIKAETKKANDNFIKQVAKLAGATEAQVRRALPDEKRITERIPRLIAALEKDLKQALSDEQKTAIQAAEDERKKMISDAQQEAGKK
jgi:flagellar motility protein MotE (MotC chaperone)